MPSPNESPPFRRRRRSQAAAHGDDLVRLSPQPRPYLRPCVQASRSAAGRAGSPSISLGVYRGVGLSLVSPASVDDYSSNSVCPGQQRHAAVSAYARVGPGRDRKRPSPPPTARNHQSTGMGGGCSTSYCQYDCGVGYYWTGSSQSGPFPILCRSAAMHLHSA